jgi:hypothetical protein
MKRKYCMSVFIAAVIWTTACTPAYADSWVESRGEWYYMDENGQRLRNTISYDGYYVDFRGKFVPLKKTEGIDRDREISSNFYFKYLETGDPSYLSGNEYISPKPYPTDSAQQMAIGYWYLNYYEDYYSCVNGILTPTNETVWTNAWVNLSPGTGDRVYPRDNLEKLQKTADEMPLYGYDENYVRKYYATQLYDNGDFIPLTNAKKRGIQIYEVPFPNSNSRTVFQVISKRDAYRIYKEFLDMATAGIEDMSERELALHLLKVVKKQLSYSHSEEEAANAGEHVNTDMVLTILAGGGVCTNYSSMYQLLCRTVGLECEIEEGTSAEGGGHTWNLVRADGTWYHVDATWADTDRLYDGLMEKCPHMGNNCEMIRYPQNFN